MPLDLVGKLHRTVYITSCPPDSQEDLLHMLLRRCGAIEAWDAVDGRLIVVFQSMNSVSNALTFHGLSFVDLTKKICVWKATETPPAEATQQLAIQGSSAAPASPGTAEAGAATGPSAEEEDARRAHRKERRAALQELLNSRAADVIDTSTPEGRRAKMVELCHRQLKALATLTAAAVRDARAELADKQENLLRVQELLHMQEAAASTPSTAPGAGADAPPTSRPRLE